MKHGREGMIILHGSGTHSYHHFLPVSETKSHLKKPDFGSKSPDRDQTGQKGGGKFKTADILWSFDSKPFISLLKRGASSSYIHHQPPAHRAFERVVFPWSPDVQPGLSTRCGHFADRPADLGKLSKLFTRCIPIFN